VAFLAHWPSTVPDDELVLDKSVEMCADRSKGQTEKTQPVITYYNTRVVYLQSKLYGLVIRL
jgi:hypothetical protein